MPKKQSKSPAKTSDGRIIVSAFRSKQKFIERILGKYEIDWAREMKIANKLYSIYPIRFLHYYYLDFDVPSLAYFISGKGKKNIDLAHKIWQNRNQAAVPALEQFEFNLKVEPDFKKEVKPRTIFDL